MKIVIAAMKPSLSELRSQRMKDPMSLCQNPSGEFMAGDVFGGQNSLGCESYGGAKGGMIFVCPMSGSIILKLYAKAKQFPAILYQVLQHIESQGFVCRELMVDTYVLNLS